MNTEDSEIIRICTWRCGNHSLLTTSFSLATWFLVIFLVAMVIISESLYWTFI